MQTTNILRAVSQFLMGLAFFAVPALAGAILSIQPSPQTVSVGQTFSENVVVSGATDLFAYQFDLGYDPTVLAAIGITEGAFLPGGGGTAFIVGNNNGAGTISNIADTLTGALAGRTGGGVLAAARFTALKSGSSAVNLINVTLLDSTLSGISSTATNGQVTVNLVPEPSTSMLFGCGLLVLVFSLRREQNGSRI